MSKANGIGPRRVMERLFGIVAVLAGLGMAAPGGYLLALGGSAYHLAAGLLLAITGVDLWRGRARGAWLFLLVWLGTLAWALWEAGPDGWALLPRLGLLTGMGLALALIRWRPGARAARAAATGAIALALLAGGGLALMGGRVRSFVRGAIEMDRKGPSIWRLTRSYWISCWRGVIPRSYLPRTG